MRKLKFTRSRFNVWWLIAAIVIMSLSHHDGYWLLADGAVFGFILIEHLVDYFLERAQVVAELALIRVKRGDEE